MNKLYDLINYMKPWGGGGIFFSGLKEVRVNLIRREPSEMIKPRGIC